MKPLTLALTKGRILKETLPLLAGAGIVPEEDIASSRKLVFNTKDGDMRLLLLRGSDVPTYVRHGIADIGIAGKDMLLEQGMDDLYELLDLQIARCQLMTAGMAGVNPAPGKRTVATKFVNIARAYYAREGIQVNVVKLYGAMELAPVLSLADEIVDIVDTGNTLRANGLEPRADIAAISSRLIANKAAFKTTHDRLRDVVERLQAALPTTAPRVSTQ